jgi:hypothetical protein
VTRPRTRGRLALFGGGTDGNEQLTAVTGVVLIALLAVIGLTILRMRQLISVHLFVGLLLIGPVALKMATTGYRFTRYYTHNPPYRQKGPPEPILRMIAPVIVLTTVLVFISGLLLLFGGPRSKDSWLALHKVSFIVWVVFTALHVLGHLPGLPESLRATRRDRPSIGRDGTLGASPGEAGRWLALAGVLVAGVVLAIVLIPDFHSWTAAGAFHHDHHG